MRVLTKPSLFYVFIGIMVISSCSKEKDVEPQIDLTSCYAEAGAPPFDRARIGTAPDKNGRVQYTVEHLHNYNQSARFGPSGDRDYHLYVRGCSLANATSTVEYGKNKTGQQLIDNAFYNYCPFFGFGGHLNVGTTKTASTQYAGYVDFDTILGGYRVNRFYKCINEFTTETDILQYLRNDLALAVYQ